MKKLKYNIEKPTEEFHLTHPSDDTKLYWTRQYLQKAIKAYKEKGGKYEPTEEEIQSKRFNENVPHLKEITAEKRSYSPNDDFILSVKFEENEVVVSKTDTAYEKGMTNEKFDKQYILEELKDLYIGEWENEYTPEKFGITIMDGFSWDIEFVFSNKEETKRVLCQNIEPHNFNDFLNLFSKDE